MESEIELIDGKAKVNKLSIRDKLLKKRNLNRIRNQDSFQAGPTFINDPSLYKTGIRGTKSFTFWLLIGMMYFLAICNLVLTITLMAILRIGWGIEAIEMLPYMNTIKFYGNVDLGKLYKDDGYFKSFKDFPMTITAQQRGSINIEINHGVNSTKRMFTIGPNGVEVMNVKEFNVYDPEGHMPIFSTGFPNFGLPRGVKKLDVQQMRTSRITSPIEDDLVLRSETFTRLKGNEGVHMIGGNIQWTADKDIFLKSVNGSIVLESENGIYLDVKKLPIVQKTMFLDANITDHIGAFKLCVCMPLGKIFRVRIDDDINSQNACLHIDTSPEHHPCR